MIPGPPTSIKVALCTLAAGVAVAGCGEDCCTFDPVGVDLTRTTDGALVALLEGGGERRLALVDTAAPINLWRIPQGAEPRTRERDFDLLDPAQPARVRAEFRGVGFVDSALGPGPGVAGRPSNESLGAVISGEFLRNFSVDFEGERLVFWDRQPASDGFLSINGFAVLHLAPLGGGQLNLQGNADLFGQSPTVQFPATRLVVRTCGVPAIFDRATAPPARCCRGDERTLATGVDLSLALGTGYGPVVLSESAWSRLSGSPEGASLVAGESCTVDHPTLPRPLGARCGTLPRLALVDLEEAEADDPGPCAELGRARRLEQIAVLQAAAAPARAPSAPCAQPCDLDRRAGGRPHDSSGYVELSDDIRVAVVPDDASVLQALRAEVRPGGPELDGILGADVLSRTGLEVDYRSLPFRLIVSCSAQAAPASCRAVGRCPRLPDGGSTHRCFGLPAHGLPMACETPASCP